MTFTSHSQAGQDAWAHDLLVVKPHRTEPGVYLDIGANHPTEISNTYEFERLGWKGFLIDNDVFCCELCRQRRTAQVIETDSTTFDFHSLPVRDFDYLSLDVDGATLPTLERLLLAGITFRLATIEHDMYRFGPGPRDAMRALLKAAGYTIAVADVEHEGQPYEDWYFDLKRV